MLMRTGNVERRHRTPLLRCLPAVPGQLKWLKSCKRTRFPVPPHCQLLLGHPGCAVFLASRMWFWPDTFTPFLADAASMMRDLAQRHRLVETGQQVLGKDMRSASFVSVPVTLDSTLASPFGLVGVFWRVAGALCLARVLARDSQSPQETIGLWPSHAKVRPNICGAGGWPLVPGRDQLPLWNGTISSFPAPHGCLWSLQSDVEALSPFFRKAPTCAVQKVVALALETFEGMLRWSVAVRCVVHDWVDCHESWLNRMCLQTKGLHQVP